ncbi:MAG: protein translocase SEC61 complex subunit gamma [Nitrososphaerota archaeon]|nr:protein translocase SEC61 complex subunit gamma [Candidatus Calditenuaceae archaeon]MDW8072926.1 protein translocase SEC61 complex subunit gamma [Nitrososphaerota archaeon]
MGFKEFARSVVTVFRVAQKPSRETYLTFARVALLGVFILGVISFLIRFLMIALQGGV